MYIYTHIYTPVSQKGGTNTEKTLMNPMVLDGNLGY